MKIGDLERHKEVTKVVKPKFNNEMFPEAHVREGVDELTLRSEMAGMLRAVIDTTSVEDRRWRPPLVDED